MQTKLTLRMDAAAIDQAKRWARMHGVSLSKAVEEFFTSLPGAAEEFDLTPWTRGLVGAAARGGSAPSDEELAREDLDRLEKKYQ